MATYGMIQEAVNEFGEKIKDIVTLDVVTLTGEITIDAALDDNQKIDLQELYKAIEKGASVQGKLDIVAFTHVDLDADAVNFVKRDLTPEQKGLLMAHGESVKAAQETRAGVVAMIRSFFP